MEDSLQRIEKRLEELASRERKANGFQLWLWVINAVVVPGLAFCLYHVVSISSNRYTSMDATEHIAVHLQHTKEHAKEAERIAKIESKLAGLPPAQIDENRKAIRLLEQEMQRHLREDK